MASYGSVPFPGGQPSYAYANPNAGYAPAPGGGGGYGMQGMQGMQAHPMASSAPAADPYANAQPGTIAYAKSEGPDGIATYTPVIAQETFYQTPAGPTRGIKWVTATSSQASAAGIPSGAITTNNAAQLPQPNGMSIPPLSVPMSALPPPGSTVAGYPPESPGDDYPVQRPGMSQREYEKAVKRWEKDRRAADKRARKEQKERQKGGGHDGTRDGGWGRDPQDPYDIAGRQPEGGRPRRMSAGAGLGFDRARRMSGGTSLRDDELSRKLETLDMSFNNRRERRMSGNYAPSAGGFRSRKGSVTEAERPRKMSGSYDLPRPSYYPTGGAPMSGAPGGGYPPIPGGYGAGARSMPGSPVRSHSAFQPSHYDDVGVPPMRGGPSPHPGPYSRSRHPSPSMGGSAQLPGGYGGGSYGGARDPNSASAYAYGTERTPYSTASAQLPGGPGDSYALTTTRRPGTAASGAGGYPNMQVSGREINRAQPFTPFEEFFLVEDLKELLQPQPPPLPAALVPHDVMADEWDRCMQSLIHMTSQAVQSARSSALDPLIEVITQWNTQFFLPRGVDIGIYKGNSRRSGPTNVMNMESKLRAYDESESDSDSSSSSSSTDSSSEDDRYFSSTRREQRAAKKAERKVRRKEKARRRRARRRQRSVSIRVRVVPMMY